MQSLDIVVPVFNEESNIAKLAARISSACSEASKNLTVIFVDDGSTDNSWSEISNLNDSNLSVLGIRFTRNFGKESAIIAGLDRSNADVVIVMDSDLQHPPETIPELFTHWKNGAKIVEAEKIREVRTGILRRLLTPFAYKILHTLTGLSLSGKSDFILLDKEVRKMITDLPEYHRFFRGLVAWTGIETTKVTFQVEPRHAGRSRWSINQLLNLFITIVTGFTTLPLRLITFCSLIMIVISLALGVQTLYNYASGNAVQGFTTVILCTLFTGGVISAALGVIGEYLARIYEETKKRPKYILRDTI